MTTKKLKIKNITDSPYGARTITGVKMIPPGQVLEDEFEAGEAKNIEANSAVFETGDHVTPELGRAASNAASRRLAELSAENEALKTENAELKEALAALTPPSGAGKMTLAEAAASLDDKNDAHWIESGKPNLRVLSDLVGSAVSRADVDALEPSRVRKTD